MSWLLSQKGRLTIGLLVMSSGGLLLAQILPHLSRNDEVQAEKLNLLLIFWVLFCGKMIYQFSLKSSKDDENGDKDVDSSPVPIGDDGENSVSQRGMKHGKSPRRKAARR